MTGSPSRLVAGCALAAAVVASLAGAGCGSSSPGPPTAAVSPSTTPGPTASASAGPGSTGTTGTTGAAAPGSQVRPATTRPRATGSTATGRDGSAAATGSATCALLTVDQVSAETGATVARSTAVGPDCVWDDAAGAPVLRLQVDGGTPDGPDAASRFATAQTLYGDATATADLSGIGEAAFVHGLDRAVVFRQGDQVVKVWVQAGDPDGRLAASVALARIISAEG